MDEQRFTLGARGDPTAEPGLVRDEVGNVFVISPSGVRTQLPGAGSLPDPSGEPDGDILTVQSGAAVWAPNGGSSPVLLTSKTLLAADLLALHTTPVELLPDPGGRFYYVVHRVIYHYRPGATPYAGGDPTYLIVGYGSTVVDVLAAAIIYPVYDADSSDGILGAGSDGGASFLTQPTDTYVSATPSAGTNDWASWPAADIEAKALSIVNGDTAFTGGDGTLSVRTYYGLIDGA